MLTSLSDGLGITVLMTLTFVLFFFGIGPLTNPRTWRYAYGLWEAAIFSALGAVVLLVAIMMIIT